MFNLSKKKKDDFMDCFNPSFSNQINSNEKLNDERPKEKEKFKELEFKLRTSFENYK
jgi:hypothetical protein